MVNYNNETTVATPSVDINKIQILERRAYVIEALEKCNEYASLGSKGKNYIFISRLVSLFWELQGVLERRLDKDRFLDYKNLALNVKHLKFEKAINMWMDINKVLDEIKLTLIDTKKEYDTTNPESENKELGL